jgi:hypothetical protein
MKTTRNLITISALAILVLFATSCKKDSLVSVITHSPTEITATTALCGGEFTFATDEIGPFTVGVCWSTSPKPTHNDQRVTYPYQQEPFVINQANPWECVISGLQPNTQYYVRAFVHPSHDNSNWGTGYYYGDQVTFTTSGNGESGDVMDGAVKGLFSVSENDKVYFSKGNLQYQASSNTWRFAENQWDCVGNGNSNISSSYSGWIDLFGWATSGYYYDGTCHYPWTCSPTGNYVAYGNHYANLDDETGQADWGYNAISNGGNRIGQWRTLSEDEWEYLVLTRNTASGIRFAKATVNGVYGVILLPDDWNSSVYGLRNTNDETSASYGDNVISDETWLSVLEPAGAVFLPAAGKRESLSVYYANVEGGYWSSSGSSVEGFLGHHDLAGCLEFGNTRLYFNSESRSNGYSVRLVHDK